MKIIEIKHYIEKLFINDYFFNNHCYIVGGFVRDILLKNEPKDLDIVVDKHYGSLKLGLMIYNAIPTEVTKPRRLGNYPIWQLTFISGKFKGESIEIAETMSEEFPDNLSRQRDVKFSSLKDDFESEDFVFAERSVNSDLSCDFICKNRNRCQFDSHIVADPQRRQP